MHRPIITPVPLKITPVPFMRCPWAKGELYEAYHDQEWGVPVREDRLLFEYLVLEAAQAGLSWLTVLKKRTRYREVYLGFDPEAVAKFDDAKIESLLCDAGIVRHRQKVVASVQNAKALLSVRDEFGGFSEYLWRFVDDRSIQNTFSAIAEVPSRTDTSDAMSRDLRRRGFAFVGSTICYAFMQAVGMTNDHLVTCPRHRDLAHQG